ncbi:MAG: hypothetical protein K2L94_01575 [Alphaproteobacteria bacterium]|nr:hypothetical protein [Alphaproteobacteria bacterium]
MIKKLISFVCCLLPVGAVAAPVYLEPGADGLIPDQAGINYTDSVIIQGNSYNQTPAGVVVGTGGISVTGDMIVGQDYIGADTGQLLIATNTNLSFTLQSEGALSVGGVLRVLNGRALTLELPNNTSVAAINAALGSIDNQGSLTLNNIDALTVGTWTGDVLTAGTGSVTNAGTLAINANTIKMGTLANDQGDVTINATGQMIMGQYTNGSYLADTDASGNFVVAHTGNTDITAGNIIAQGSIQNQAGRMNITTTTGGIDVTGSVENSGIDANGNASMTITSAGAITVSGTMKNDSDGGTMKISGTSLNVAGTDSAHNDASLVNKGNLAINVTGETYLENGFDLTTMPNTNTFELDTGTLRFGTNLSDDNWLALFTNNLNSFIVRVRNGELNLTTDIINGDTNANADMTLAAQAITANSITNSGTSLNITAANAGAGTINVAQGVTARGDGTTNLIADGTITVGGAVANESTTATMNINGQKIALNTVSNVGNMAIDAYTNTPGDISITGTVTNSGTMKIESRQIKIDGVVTNADGTMTIRGSDQTGGAVTLGGLNVSGGVVDLTALTGSVSVTNNLNVTGGDLNIGDATHEIAITGTANIAGDVTAAATPVLDAGNVNIAAGGPQTFVMTATDAINIGGNVSATANDMARTIKFDAQTLDIGGNVTAANSGALIFGGNLATNLNVTGALTARDGGVIDLAVADIDVGSLGGNGKFILHGSSTSVNATIDASDANTNAIDIAGGIWFDGTNPTSGMVVTGPTNVTLATTGNGGSMNIAGGMSISSGHKLTLNSRDAVTLAGLVKNTQGTLDINANGAVTSANDIDNSGTLTIDGASITTQDITNTSSVAITAKNSGAINTGSITNSGAFTMSGGTMQSAAVSTTAGALDVTGTSWNLNNLSVTGGYANLNVNTITATNNITVAGDLVQSGIGGTGGVLNITRNNSVVTAQNLVVDGAFRANGLSADYRIADAATIGGDIIVVSVADADISAKTITAANVTNAGTLTLTAQNGMTLDVVNGMAGTMTLDSGADLANVTSFTLTGGSATLLGQGMNSTGAFTLAGRLLQNMTSASAGDANVIGDAYTITASNVITNGIQQKSGSMTLNTSDLDVHGSILASHLRVYAQGKDSTINNNWLTVNVDGDVSGGVGFVGLKEMTVGGAYTFDTDSLLHAAIMPPAATTRNYWASVSLNNDNTLGQITNPVGAEPLISVNGKFISNVTDLGTSINGGTLTNPQIGIDIFDMVDQGDAIWLVHADGGLEELALKMRNLFVKFCNADGSMCFDYLDAIKPGNNGSVDGLDLPAFLSVRDTDGDGVPDSIYIVFDPRFGGPVEVFKIQPIVDREGDHTTGEHVSAGALDKLIAGKLAQTGFFNRTPIEAIPLIFKNTNMAEMAQELYQRMEYYNTSRDGRGLARFSRLFQPREIEQIAGHIVMNEHTNFRNFEDRMFDEFIWNRHRNLKKAWLDADFGMFNQRVSDGKRVSGDRFSVSGGFDWQENPTLILGVTGRVSHMSSDNSDSMELGYKPGQHIAGHVKVDVADTDIGLGGYLMKTLGTKMRLYGNAYLDLHLLDVSREQNYVASIDGSGTAFALTSEWGLLHDWLNQYLVGNLYARVGVNSGFSVTEKAAGSDYMKLESDAYMMLTPGYSLIAQKRIYPGPWFQIRPYLSVGVEYDLLGAPNHAKYKFAPASGYTTYDIDLDPLWANAGGGVEILSASGVQVGLDYRYQYNTEMQLHQIKISGSYRF